VLFGQKGAQTGETRLEQQELQSAYKKKLAESGLTPEDGKRLHIAPLVDPRKLNILPALPGLKITYHSENGKPLDHFRFRYLVDTRTQFEKLTSSKGLRYTQPEGSPLEVYLPPIGAGMDWASAMKDNTQPLIITEGEFKAACACKEGFLTVGLGGVWSFAVNDQPLLFFEKTQWEGRQVYIIYDSDAVSNPHVNKAESRLCKLLGEHGAMPFVVRLPGGLNGTKMGLDDYLVKKGPDELEKLLEKAAPFEEVAKLHEMNEKLIVILNPSLIAERETGYVMSRALLTGVNYANAIHYEEKMDSKGNIKKLKVKTADAWMEWNGRSEASGITFAPGQEEFYHGKYNSWKKWPHVPDSKGGIEPWTTMLDYVFGNNTEHRKWFEQWCAYPLQHPGTKLATACVFHGVTQGTGKTFLGISLKEVYGEYGKQIKEEDLHDDRNEWAKNCQFILGDEVTGSDRRRMADRLKGMITQKEIRLNPKYVPSYFIPDCINYYFTSNRVDAFLIDRYDRRYFVHEMNQQPLPSAFYRRYEDWLYRKGGIAALFAHLLKVDLKGFNPQGEAPLTEAKMDMQYHSRSDLMDWAVELRENPDRILGQQKKDVYTNGDLLMLYDPDGRKKVTANGLGRVLKEAGFYRPNNGLPAVYNGASYRLYVVRNQKKWSNATLSMIVEHYLGKTK
jgi:hypothetical protein